MPGNISVENNFIGGLKTEFTGLNFPENACTATSNCVFSIIGDVLRREGINYELNFIQQNINLANLAVNSYKWNNVGGDGQSQVVVLQVGDILYFFFSSNSTAAAPLSTTLIMGTINITTYLAAGSGNNPSTTECTFADGNGYLFVFHPMCDPFYVQFVPGSSPSVTSGMITLQIRDLVGIDPEPGNPNVSFRPTSLTNEHSYNLQNQGWTNATTWTTSSNTNNLTISGPGNGNNIGFPTMPGSYTFTVASGLTVTAGTQVTVNWSAFATYLAAGDGSFNTTATGSAIGNVTSYTGTSMTINLVSQTVDNIGSGGSWQSFGTPNSTIGSTNLINTITTWNTQIGNYPSNADIWYEFKDAGTLSGENGVPTFNPADTIAQVPLSQTQAPQGHFILNAFNQMRSNVSGITGIANVTTLKRPRCGCWFQGRVWYAGVDDSQLPTGDFQYYTWTENIYFSQVVGTPTDFGACYQSEDPTNDILNQLLPTDGGVIVIQGCGAIYKLFPIQNGLLVFAANGVWLIRGNSGLGFTADDFSINKISAVQSIASTSYVDVLGLPFFWNSEGIYRVVPTQGNAPYGFGGFDVEPLTVGTILTFYNNIPFDSKRFVRGAYDPISYVISWVYRSTEEAGISNRYQYDSSLNLNIYNKAFYPYAITAGPNNFVCGIQYVNYPTGGLTPTFKYLTNITGNSKFTFAEENDSLYYVDWFSYDNIGVNFTSSFTTGYKIHGQAFRKWQPIYVNIYSNNEPVDIFYVAEDNQTFYVAEDGVTNYVPESELSTAYVLQAVWDYANSTSTGKISTRQVVYNPINSIKLASGAKWPDTIDFGNVFRRHKLRGHGQVLQLEISSVAGYPFHIIGWSIPETIAEGS